MQVVISPAQIKEIAGELDSGMKCFYHIATGEVKSYPDELRGHEGFEEEFWEDVMAQVESAPGEFVAFQPRLVSSPAEVRSDNLKCARHRFSGL